jgi:hypothetical protein
MIAAANFEEQPSSAWFAKSYENNTVAASDGGPNICLMMKASIAWYPS